MWPRMLSGIHTGIVCWLELEIDNAHLAEEDRHELELVNET
jgi:hypothetical protein